MHGFPEWIIWLFYLWPLAVGVIGQIVWTIIVT